VGTRVSCLKQEAWAILSKWVSIQLVSPASGDAIFSVGEDRFLKVSIQLVSPASGDRTVPGDGTGDSYRVSIQLVSPASGDT